MPAPERVDEKAVAPRPGAPAIAYVMSRFPKVTETFVLYEAVALLDAGREVRLYPLLLEEAQVQHPEVDRVASRVRFRPFLDLGVLGGSAALACTRPLRTAGAFFALVGAYWRSPKRLAQGLALFPKTLAYARDMEREGVRHVHAHFANHPATVAWMIHRLTRIPFSFTAHGSDLHVDQTGLAQKLRAAAFGVQISDYNRRFVLERVGEWATSRLRVVRCGVDLEAFREVPERARPEPTRRASEPLSILCVASLRRVKGHVHLLDALKSLKDAAVPFRCRLVGDGPLRGALAARIDELGLAARVELLGARSRPDVLAELARADVVCLTSVQDAKGRREGIPVSLMEAMACGCPVVASDLSGIPELVTDGVEGMLAPPGDSEALALALTRLWEDPDLRHQMGKAGRARVASEYDLAKNSADLIALFDESLGPRPEARPPRPKLVAG